MGNISSIHFKKTNKIQTQHNDRTLPPSYIQDRGNFEVNRNSQSAEKLRDSIVSAAVDAYNATKKDKAPSFKATSYEWSAVANIKDTTTMADLEKLAEYFQNEHGFQCYQIAIHRDEGHKDENGKVQINHHAHLEFITLDKTTGKNLYNRANITPKKLREIQDKVAEILQMERGVDVRKSKTKRVEPRKYAQLKEQEKAERIKLKAELKAQRDRNEALVQELEMIRKDMVEVNKMLGNDDEHRFTRDDYMAINDAKRGQIDKKRLEEIKSKVKELKSPKVAENAQNNDLVRIADNYNRFLAEKGYSESYRVSPTATSIELAFKQVTSCYMIDRDSVKKYKETIKEQEGTIEKQNQELTKLKNQPIGIDKKEFEKVKEQLDAISKAYDNAIGGLILSLDEQAEKVKSANSLNFLKQENRTLGALLKAGRKIFNKFFETLRLGERFAPYDQLHADKSNQIQQMELQMASQAPRAPQPQKNLGRGGR